jgi:Ribonuclease III domain
MLSVKSISNSFAIFVQHLAFSVSVADFLITCYIYEQCGNLSPGAMTDLRSALVNNVVFGSLTVRFGLHSHLLQNSPSLFQLVDTFVEYQQSNDFAITEEVRHSCFCSQFLVNSSVRFRFSYLLHVKLKVK